MDADIRDLLAVEDVFDPFEEDDESEEVVVPAAPDEEGIIGAPLEPKEIQEKPILPPEERIAALLESMPGQKKLLLRLVDHCREPKTGEEMDGFTLDLQQHCYSVYSPVVLRELLEEAGAIEYLPAEGESTEFAQADELLPAQESMTESNPEIPFLDGGVLVSVDESKIKHESLIEDGEELVLDYLEVEEREAGLWMATGAGVAAVDAVDELANTEQLLEQEPRYLDIYHQILAFCSEEEYGRSSKEIDNLVNDSPLLQEPRRYSGYFVSRLEREGALEWRGGWCVTEAGKAVIAKSQAQVEEGASHE